MNQVKYYTVLIKRNHWKVQYWDARYDAKCLTVKHLFDFMVDKKYVTV